MCKNTTYDQLQEDIDSYFDNVSREQLIADLIKADIQFEDIQDTEE